MAQRGRPKKVVETTKEEIIAEFEKHLNKLPEKCNTNDEYSLFMTEETKKTYDEYVIDRGNEIIETITSNEVIQPIENEYTYEDIQIANSIDLIKYTHRNKRNKLIIIKDIVKLFNDLGTIQPKDLITIKRMFNLYNEYKFGIDKELDYTCNDCITKIYVSLRNIAQNNG